MDIENLDTDPRCQTKRECWRCDATRQAEGDWYYARQDGEDSFAVQPSQKPIPANGIAVVHYASSGSAMLAADVPGLCRVLSDNGWLLVLQALERNICAIKVTGGNITLRHVTVLSTIEEYNQMTKLGRFYIDETIRPLTHNGGGM
ncbi:hypothetical protein KIH79_06685 [Bifidobacterium sp. 82T10]|uniref:Uncharacterized protein n=1 Tax=Bifidobacterium miconis TaxID=2834435 RepID=A0ABS6WF12_9BIFI|nr:hypothetical protein [Bifidobacterium miconis]MBW3092636.1 hypothetical protein [Bifidobacterium miconis]